MKHTLKPLTVAVLITIAQLSGGAYAQSTRTPAAQAAPATTKAPIAIKSPTDWIVYDDTIFTPVADPISLHLDAARKAFDAKDTKRAAAAMRTVADELKQQAARAANTDKARAKSDMQLAHDTSTRMTAVAGKVSAAAADIESGKIKTKADLDKTIGTAERADIERRWLVTDAATWYPVTEEPQRHFGSAVGAYAKKDYKAAATEIRKATGYMRLESARVTGAAKQALDRSVADLDKLASAVEKGGVKDEKVMDKAFANANQALAQAHRTQAADSWARKEYNQAGYELKAAAHGLESASGWVGAEAKKGSSTVVADTRALGDKLTSGMTWTRNEVVKGFETLGNSIDAMGQKIDRSKN